MKYFFKSFILTDVLTLQQDGNCLLTLLFGRKHVMLTLRLEQKTCLLTTLDRKDGSNISILFRLKRTFSEIISA